MSAVADISDINLSDLAFWALPQRDRAAAFARLREDTLSSSRLPFFAEPKIPLIKPGPGYYALTTHADVVEASRRPDVFSSEPASNSIPDMPRYLATYFGSMINMDDPRHAKIRRVVSRAFTPRMLAGLHGDLQRTATAIVDGLIAHRSGDFVADAAARLPIQVICDLMGIPASRHAMVLAHTNRILAGGDPEYTGVRVGAEPTALASRLHGAASMYKLVRAGRSLHRLAAALGEERRRHPAPDLTTALVTSDLGDHRSSLDRSAETRPEDDQLDHLTPQEFGSFFILLVVAGNETTRTAISHGLQLLTDHPDQLELLLSDFERYIPSAVDEIIRYATPVIQFRRTLTRDHVLNGKPLRRGDKVLLFYNAANRDPAVFDRPDEFDITRVPNPHLGFGGPGPHFCLGAHLARTEITVLFRELFSRAPRIRAVGEPDRLVSSFINGVKRMQYAL